MRVGLIGCGNISGIYFQNAAKLNAIEITACADLDMARAEAKAAEYGVARTLTVDALLNDPEIDAVLNLTVPGAHASVCMRALEAGKHVYVEKPLAVNRSDGKRLLDFANARELRIGCAPDTFMGAGLQTCRQLLDEGVIGRPVAATAFMLGHGPEAWHPDPEFFFKPGAGPMFDMGPYYLTALISLMGPVKRVAASASISFPQRTITSKPHSGTVIDVETPTHLAGVLDFECGAVATLVTSFDVWSANVPCIEIYGTEGSMSVPDPNGFGGAIKVRKAGESNWKKQQLTHGFADNSRGLGLADMAAAIAGKRPHRASGALAFHVLDVMEGFLDSSKSDRMYRPVSTVERPAPVAASVGADGEGL